MTSTPNHEPQEQAQAIAAHRGRSLLVLYWPDDGEVQEDDVRDLRKFLKAQGLTRDTMLPRLDVLIETIGGESDPPYLIGQMLHDYADKISFLVPNKALSAGTEICLAGHQIIMGEDATLSPIDTQIRDDEGRWWSETAIEHFRELADGAEGEDTRTAIIESTIGSIAPETIAKAYRESRVAAQHAEQLLNQHMLKDASPDQIQEVLDRLTKTAPSHEWAIDYHLAKQIGLKVKRMDEGLNELTKNVASQMKCEIAVGNRRDGKTGNSVYFIFAPASNEPASGTPLGPSEQPGKTD